MFIQYFPHPSASAGLEVGGGLQEFHLWHPEKIYGIQNRFNLRILPCYTCHAAKNCILRKQEILPDILFKEIEIFSVVELKILELFTSGQYFSQIVRFWLLKILIRMPLCTIVHVALRILEGAAAVKDVTVALFNGSQWEWRRC